MSEELLGLLLLGDPALEVVLTLLVSLPTRQPVVPLVRLAPAHPHVVHVEHLRT